MTVFRVWAPRAQRVDLDLDGRRHAMEEAENGWFISQALQHKPDSDYGFSIDGDEPLPDPRTPRQPHGVHGLSRPVDHSVFRWTDQQWAGGQPLSSALIYELHVGTFSPAGTFDGVIDQLDHLCDLGVTHVELMPVAQFPGNRGWGYDGVDLFAPHESYGGPAGLRRLVDACHAKGLAVLLDVVYNHLGPSGNYLSRYGPYFTDHHSTPWGDAVNTDGPDSGEARRFFCDNALMWLRDYHFDGLRLDAVQEIVDTTALHLLEQLGEEVAELEAGLGRRLVLIAESDANDPRYVRPRPHGYGLNAQWNDDFHHALHAALTGERGGYYADFGSLEKLAKTITDAWVHDGSYSTFRRRCHGRPPGDLSGHRFLAYMQNHDQVGNRATGDRIGSLVSEGRVKIGAALTMVSPYVPMIFQGEEWGASTPFLYFTDHEDRDLGRAVTEGRRREFAAFGWDPDRIPDPRDSSTFGRSRLDWSEVDREPHASMLRWYRDLIGLRRRVPGLRNGRRDRVRTDYDEDEQWIAVSREGLQVACNLSAERRRVPFLHDPTTPRQVLCSAQASEIGEDSVVLPPDSVVLVIPSS
ncbi:MAG: malto-oligosyltrehalose trehalohydrolase [Dehalococcoidia bacterium]|nr:malto-oligosyltrehalose trehalohydrolase [Dehalococcoidia bacterium]